MANDFISHDYVTKLLETGASGERRPPRLTRASLHLAGGTCPAWPLSPSHECPPPRAKLPRCHQGPCSASPHRGTCPLPVTGTGVRAMPGRVCVVLTGPRRRPGPLRCGGPFWDILGPRALRRLYAAVVQGAPGICDRELSPFPPGQNKNHTSTPAL